MENRTLLLWVVRIAWLITGILWFIWIGYEDRGVTSVLLVALTIVIAFGMTMVYRAPDLMMGGNLARPLLLGLGAGLSIPILTSLLMLVKISLHDHPIPDFSVDDSVQVLGLLPIWGLIGLLVGAGLVGISRSQRET